MFRLNNKAAFTIIEVLCAMGMFTLLFLFIVTVNLNIKKIEYNKENNFRYTSFFEAFKNKIVANTAFQEVVMLKGNTLYIKGENLYLEKLKYTNIVDLVQINEPVKEPFIKLELTGTDVIKTNMELHYSEFKQKLIKKMSFYKGNYS